MTLKDRMKTLVSKIRNGSKISTTAIDRAKKVIEAAKQAAKN